MIITAAILKKIAPNANKKVIEDLETYLAPYLEKYEINTPFRVAHFLAQAAHESASFKTLQEYASGEAYEGRKDLGNVKKGDGRLFKGRGIFQLTGRANYTEMSKKLDVDLVKNPELAATGKISVLTACEYWKSRNLNKYADLDDIKKITKKINGGYNGFDDRVRYWKIIKKHINEIFSQPTPLLPDETPAPIREEVELPIAEKGSKGGAVFPIQVALTAKGAKIVVDGDFGARTEKAVLEFQKANGLEPTGKVYQATYDLLMTP